MRLLFLLPLRCLSVLLLGLAPLAPAAALDVIVDSLQLSSDALNPTTVGVDVWLDLAPGETPPDVTGFQVVVTLSGPVSGVSITPPATLPSGLHPSLITSNFTPDFAASDGPSRVSAAAFLDVGSTPISDGAGLMRFDVQIDASTSGVFTLSVDTDPVLGTVLADPLGSPLTYGTLDGVLTIAEPVPVLPAPLRLGLLALLGGIALCGVGRARVRA